MTDKLNEPNDVRTDYSAGNTSTPSIQRRKVGSDLPFFTVFLVLSFSYLLLIISLLVADAAFTSLQDIGRAFESKEIRYSFMLSMVSCTLASAVSLLIAIPIGYLMSRFNFTGKNLIDGILDIPIVLPPLVIGLSLLILFQTGFGRSLDKTFSLIVDKIGLNNLLEMIGVKPIRGITYELPSVILAQFSVACAFAVRTMRVTFDQISKRFESVALTLGCRRDQAFRYVVLPEAIPGIIAAGTLAWARSLGEFGPILVFSGATRMKTEVLPTTVFLELSIGDGEAAVAVSMIMVVAAFLVLGLTRVLGLRTNTI